MHGDNIIKFGQMKKYFFDRETSKNFLEYLTGKGSVFAPHKKGEASYSFEQVENVDDVVFNYPRTIQPLKKYFLPAQETLLNFNLADNTFTEPEIKEEKRIFLQFIHTKCRVSLDWIIVLKKEILNLII